MVKKADADPNNVEVTEKAVKKPKQPKGKKKNQINEENPLEEPKINNDEGSLDESNKPKDKSNAGRPKKKDVSINDLDFKFITTTYNISAFSVQFRKQIMCAGNSDATFNKQFEKFGKKNNKNHFDKEVLDDLEQRLEIKRKEYDDDKMRLYTFVENIKLHLQEYYDNEEQKQLENSIIDDLFEKISSQQNYVYDQSQFPTETENVVIQPFFWEIIANIMVQEKQNKIDKSFLDLLD